MGKNNIKTDASVVNKMIEMSKDGKSSIAISKELGVSKRTVLNYLRDNGIVLMTERQKFLKKKPEIIRLHLEGKTVDEICKACNSKHTQVKRLLTDEGFTTPSRKKYSYDENIFSIIDTEEKAYWLGFIYADGNISDSKGYPCKMTIGIKDREHILKFLEFICGEKEQLIERNGYSFVEINSKKVCCDLIEKGAIPRKSLVLTFPHPDIIPDHLMRHFIRGYFDGDGGISIRKRTYHNASKVHTICALSVVGTKEFIDTLQSYFVESLSVVTVKLYQHGSNTFEYSKQGTQAIKILEFLYDESNVYLDRKYNKLTALLSGD